MSKTGEQTAFSEREVDDECDNCYLEGRNHESVVWQSVAISLMLKSGSS